jgi:hypothetical protein
MDIENAERYEIARSVVFQARPRGGDFSVVMSVIEKAINEQEPNIDLSKNEDLELEWNPHKRFERLWDQGNVLLEVSENNGGKVEGKGFTPSHIAVSVTLSFSQEIPAPIDRIMRTRVIEAQWADDFDRPLGSPEIIRETETELDHMKNETLSADSLRRMLLVEESIFACRDLRSQQNGINQPEPVVFR